MARRPAGEDVAMSVVSESERLEPSDRSVRAERDRLLRAVRLLAVRLARAQIGRDGADVAALAVELVYDAIREAARS
jgi:hypothetical protein